MAAFIFRHQQDSDNSRIEAFSRDLSFFVFRKLGVIQDNYFEPRPTLTDGIFTESIGNAVLYHQLLIRNCLSCFFTCHFNRIVADVESITYEFCSRIYAFSNISFCQKFFRISAFVLELFLYCKECRIRDGELIKAPLVWKLIFDLVIKQDFYRQEGGWDMINLRSLYYCEQLSRHFEPLFGQLVNDPYAEIPIMPGIPDEFAQTNNELREVLATSYEEAVMQYIGIVPLPSFYRREDWVNDEELVRSSSSPSPVRVRTSVVRAQV